MGCQQIGPFMATPDNNALIQPRAIWQNITHPVKKVHRSNENMGTDIFTQMLRLNLFCQIKWDVTAFFMTEELLFFILYIISIDADAMSLIPY